MSFNSNLGFVEFVREKCTDVEFVDAITGFYLDSQNDESGVKAKALEKFANMVSIDAEGKPSIDEVQLLDIYEEMLG